MLTYVAEYWWLWLILACCSWGYTVGTMPGVWTRMIEALKVDTRGDNSARATKRILDAYVIPYVRPSAATFAGLCVFVITLVLLFASAAHAVWTVLQG